MAKQKLRNRRAHDISETISHLYATVSLEFFWLLQIRRAILDDYVLLNHSTALVE